MDLQKELLCCRACLVTDCKLFNIHDYELADAFSQISGTPVLQGKLSQFLCIYCCALLRKSTSFRSMCLRSQQFLTRELVKGVINTDNIRKIDPSPRIVKLSLTSVEIIDYSETPKKYIKREPDVDIVIEPEIDIIIEPNTEIDYINVSKTDIDEPNIHTDTESNIDIVDIDSIIKQAGLKTEVYIDAKNNTRKRKTNTVKKDIETKNVDSNIKVRIANNGTDTSPRKSAIVNKRKTKVEKNVKNAVGDECKEKSENADKLDAQPAKSVKRGRPKKKSKVPTGDYLPASEFPKFESTYGVQIVILSKQEQLEEISLRKQSANYKESRFKCEDCGRGFDMGSAYDNHRVRHSPSAGERVCDVCAARFKYQNQLKRHLEQHKMKLVCRECGFVSRSRCQAKYHHGVHTGKTFECQHCGKSYNKRSSYLSHVRLSHPAMNVACDECGETFVGQNGLKYHKGRMHSKKVQRDRYKCTECAAKFICLDALNRHTDSGEHTGRPCEQCGESCASEDALQAHVGEKHPTESHRCEECRATFSSGAAFEVHHRRKHLGQRPATYSQEQYREVMRKRPRCAARAPGAGAGQFVCEQCGRRSQTAALLRIHQRMHLEVKPFACSYCPKTFATNALRSWHARTHTGEKPYQCPECPFASSQKSNLVRHHKSTHLGIHANAKCPICARVCTTRAGLRTHINSVHYGQPWPKRDRARARKTTQ